MAIASTEATELTDRQRAIFTMIYESARDKGYQPTVREIMAEFDIKGPNAVICHFVALTKKGWVKRSNSRTRSLEILRNLDGSKFCGFMPK